MNWRVAMLRPVKGILLVGAAIYVSASVLAGCVKQAVVTKSIFKDRSVWVRLELDPDKGRPASSSAGEFTSLRDELTAATLSAWMRGFRVEADRGPVGMLFGRPGESPAFVEPEIAALTPHLSKGLKIAGDHEHVAYCMTVDYSPTERFITTGWMHVRGPYLYFKISEYRTPVTVDSPAVPTVEACNTKPLPGVKTADRLFRLDYQPHDVVVGQGLTSGLMAGADRNARGEIVFSLPRILKLGTAASHELGRQTDVFNPLATPAASVPNPTANPSQSGRSLGRP